MKRSDGSTISLEKQLSVRVGAVEAHSLDKVSRTSISSSRTRICSSQIKAQGIEVQAVVDILPKALCLTLTTFSTAHPLMMGEVGSRECFMGLMTFQTCSTGSRRISAALGTVITTEISTAGNISIIVIPVTMEGFARTVGLVSICVQII